MQTVLALLTTLARPSPAAPAVAAAARMAAETPAPRKTNGKTKSSSRHAHAASDPDLDPAGIVDPELDPGLASTLTAGGLLVDPGPDPETGSAPPAGPGSGQQQALEEEAELEAEVFELSGVPELGGLRQAVRRRKLEVQALRVLTALQVCELQRVWGCTLKSEGCPKSEGIP